MFRRNIFYFLEVGSQSGRIYFDKWVVNGEFLVKGSLGVLGVNFLVLVVTYWMVRGFSELSSL